MSTPAHAKAVRTRLHSLSPLRPRLGIVLGSGFHHVLREVQADAEMAYGDLPGFPPTSVAGHAGKLIVGRLGATPVLVLSGRAHYYEGHPMDLVTFPIRALAAAGMTELVLTNAAGGINPRFHPGDFMLLTDHINLMGDSPLRGPAWSGLPRFVDLTSVYDPALGRVAVRAARAARATLRRGIYLAVSGPNYETPAEIRAFRRLGADAVGMSTVPEAIVARQLGVRVAALSCIANLAAGRQGRPLAHAEVLETAQRVGKVAAGMLREFAKIYGSTQ